MKKNKMLMAVLCCSSVIAWGVTGCSAKETAGANASQAVESSIPKEEAASEAELEENSGAELGGSSGAEPEKSSQAAPESQTSVDRTEAVSEEDDAVSMELGKVWGQVLSVEENRIYIDNQAEIAGKGEVVIQIDPEKTKILDAVNGFPVQLEDLKEGEIIFAYIKPMMTMSLPPIVNAEAVICQVPHETAAAEYVRVQEMEMQKDDSYLLTASDGTQYQVPADCEIIPFLTRNMVRLTDVQKGSTCLLWTDGETAVHKIVLFAE